MQIPHVSKLCTTSISSFSDLSIIWHPLGIVRKQVFLLISRQQKFQMESSMIIWEYFSSITDHSLLIISGKTRICKDLPLAESRH